MSMARPIGLGPWLAGPVAAWHRSCGSWEKCVAVVIQHHISFNPLHLCHIHRQTASGKFAQQYTSIGRAGVVLYLSISLWFRVPPFVCHIMNVLWC